MMVRALEMEALAEQLIQARDSRSTLGQPSRTIEGFGLTDAYGVGAALTAQWTKSGQRRVAGRKVGLTYRPRWESIGLQHPVWAPIYDVGIREGSSEFSVVGLVAPKVEVEVVFGLHHPLPVGADREEVAAAVEWAALGFEVVDCHYPEWSLTPPDMVADFGCHAGLVVGTPREMTVDEVLALSDLEVTLRCDSEEIAKGGGMDVLGGPVESVEAMLASPDAAPLRAQDLIATGALTRGAHAASIGNHWIAQVDAGPTFEQVSLQLT